MDEDEARPPGPLCHRAIEILDEARTLADDGNPVVFPNEHGKRLDDKRLRRLLWKHRIPAMVHGFRSSFRDWAAEETDHPREVIEAALAHVVQSKVEAAYARIGPVRAAAATDGRLGGLREL